MKLAEKLTVAFGKCKRIGFREDKEECHTQRENVSFESAVRSLIVFFRTVYAQGAISSRLYHIGLGSYNGMAEIDYLQFLILTSHNVAGLQIQVGNLVSMQIFDSLNQLSKIELSLAPRNLCPVFDKIAQFAPLLELGSDIVILANLAMFFDSGYCRVVIWNYGELIFEQMRRNLDCE